MLNEVVGDPAAAPLPRRRGARRHGHGNRTPGWVLAEKRLEAARRIADFMRSQVLDMLGRTSLPSESELERIFQVSRNTVRSALAMLQAEGSIDRLRGTGSFARGPVGGIYEVDDIRAYGPIEVLQSYMSYQHKVRVAELISAPAGIAGMLEIDPGEEVILVERVGMAEKSPLYLMTSYYPADLAGALLDRDLSGSAALALAEVIAPLEFADISSRFVAIPCDEAAAELLGVSDGAALMLHENVKRASNGRIVDVSFRRTRGDRYALSWSSAKGVDRSTQASPDIDD